MLHNGVKSFEALKLDTKSVLRYTLVRAIPLNVSYSRYFQSRELHVTFHPKLVFQTELQ